MRFFELYQAVTRPGPSPTTPLPDPTENLQTWLDRFKGMRGADLNEYMAQAHRRAIEAGEPTPAQRAGLEMIGHTIGFLKRFHTRSMRSIMSRAQNPSNWEKDHYGHDQYQELKAGGADADALRQHPWHQLQRRYHEDHWRSLVTALQGTVDRRDATLDHSPEADQLRRAWEGYRRFAFSAPISQWADRTAPGTPGAAADKSHDQ
jgi:hypothetical protein